MKEELFQVFNLFLEIANRHSELNPLLRDFLREVKKLVGCAAVGIRLLNGEGKIPYEAYEGFSREFYEKESPLSIKSDLCMCIDVIKGRANPELPFVTKGGSFYLNNTTRYLATIPLEEKDRTCNVCNQFGYESVALVPIRVEGQILGLLHIADPMENKIPIELVELLEKVTMQLGMAIQRVWIEDELRKAYAGLEQSVVLQTEELRAINESLQREIIERKKAEEKLQESELRIRNILESVPIGISVSTPDGKAIEANSALLNMIGYDSKEEFLKIPVISHYYDPRDREKLINLVKKGIVENFEIRTKRKDGTVIWCSVASIAQKTKNGTLFITSSQDITERKRIEEEIRAYQEQLRSLASQLSLIEERERRHIAMELHDRIGQTLAYCKIKLEGLCESISSTDHAETLDEIRKLIDDTIHSTRSLTFELSPPILYELGLDAAVEWLGEQTQKQHGILFNFQGDRQHKPMDDEIRTLLFQVIRELITNVVKHAHGHKLGVSIRRERDSLRIDIEDDGVGFVTSKINSYPGRTDGFGLFSIRERLNHIGGSIKVDSEHDRGTRVTIISPLKFKKEGK